MTTPLAEEFQRYGEPFIAGYFASAIESLIRDAQRVLDGTPSPWHIEMLRVNIASAQETLAAFEQFQAARAARIQAAS